MYSLVYYENETFYKKAFTVQTMIVFLLQLKQLSQITVNASGNCIFQLFAVALL